MRGTDAPASRAGQHPRGPASIPEAPLTFWLSHRFSASSKPRPVMPERTSPRVAYWLLVLCGMILVMVLIGGLTRLTHSGLSMVEWQPHNVLPPMSDAGWRAAFEEYKRYPEYRIINPDLDLAGFKEIFWFEYVHRLWGRLIGLALVVPLTWFVWRRAIARPLVLPLVGVLALFGLQGVLGWVMVASGLVDRPDVSHYRLAAHLIAAFILYLAMLWIALGILSRESAEGAPAAPPRLRRWVAGLGALTLVTVLWGAFVAGLDAGFVYNTFPLMGDHLWPDGPLGPEGGLRAAVDDVAIVQFIHRVLATATLVGALLAGLASRRRELPRRARLALRVVALAAAAQFALGVSTLLLTVPVALGAAHQVGALLLMTAVAWAVSELRGPAPAAAADRTSSRQASPVPRPAP